MNDVTIDHKKQAGLTVHTPVADLGSRGNPCKIYPPLHCCIKCFKKTGQVWLCANK